VLDSREAMPLRQSSSSTSSNLTPCVSQIHLNYESMENHLRTTQDVLVAEQEHHGETRESVNAFNAQIQAFMGVKNKNTFIAFLTFTDNYMCFTYFTLTICVLHILHCKSWSSISRMQVIFLFLLGSRHRRGVG
jgi:hypothetical protein